MPIPRIYCLCPTCRDARRFNSKTKRTRSSALLEIRGKHILFDAGPDILRQLERAKTFCVDAVFLTHAHNDASGGFWNLNDLLKYQKHRAVIFAEGMALKKLRRDHDKLKFDIQFHSIKPGIALKLFGLRIVPFRVEHSAVKSFPTVGYRVNDAIVYASDIKKIPKESKKFIKNIPHAVLDGCMWFSRQIPTHLNTEEAIKIAERLNVRNLYLTQISHRYPPYKIATREIKKYCLQNKIRTKVRLAYDNLQLTINS